MDVSADVLQTKNLYGIECLRGYEIISAKFWGVNSVNGKKRSVKNNERYASRSDKARRFLWDGNSHYLTHNTQPVKRILESIHSASSQSPKVSVWEEKNWLS
jgi:hypothetical protein